MVKHCVMDFICVNVAILKLDKFSHFGCFGSNSFSLIELHPVKELNPVKKESYITIVVEGNYLLTGYCDFLPKIMKGLYWLLVLEVGVIILSQLYVLLEM